MAHAEIMRASQHQTDACLRAGWSGSRVVPDTITRNMSRLRSQFETLLGSSGFLCQHQLTTR
jgi:hypothetical protein